MVYLDCDECWSITFNVIICYEIFLYIYLILLVHLEMKRTSSLQIRLLPVIMNVITI